MSKTGIHRTLTPLPPPESLTDYHLIARKICLLNFITIFHGGPSEAEKKKIIHPRCFGIRWNCVIHRRRIYLSADLLKIPQVFDTRIHCSVRLRATLHCRMTILWASLCLKDQRCERRDIQVCISHLLQRYHWVCHTQESVDISYTKNSGTSIHVISVAMHTYRGVKPWAFVYISSLLRRNLNNRGIQKCSHAY